jgi:copper oxidase (laccase) domain-containing protein
MASFGTCPSDVVAGIGPAVTVDRYQVGDEVADAVRASFGAAGGAIDDVVRPDGTGRWLVDLWAANRRILVEAGLRSGNIEVSPVGTGPGTPFFSDRAARPCGRFAALARLQAR